ncbi:MAG: D-alanine--D-alanine ligase [Alphaproteobacteria bacterium]|nr:D-alanine--D-alanine ligase [Alphaproteobacteria bacterium]
MRIGFVYDLRDEYLSLGYSELEVAEFDSTSTIEEIEAAFVRLGYTVDRVGRGQELARRLAAGERYDLVFSIAEGLAGRSREAQVPALCELFGQPYAFSDPLTMAATLDKVVAKQIVIGSGVPTATFAQLRSASDADHVALAFPLFVKPVAEGTGKGCDAASIVRNKDELRQSAVRLIERFQQPALAESYLPGREFTVGILGAGESACVIGVAEITVREDADDPVYSYQNKETCEETVIYTLVDDAEARRAAFTALQAYRALDCRDAARLDFKSDANGVPHFLEVNPIAGLHPTHSDLPIIAELAGLGYDGLIAGIIASAVERLGLPVDVKAAPVRSGCSCCAPQAREVA